MAWMAAAGHDLVLDSQCLERETGSEEVMTSCLKCGGSIVVSRAGPVEFDLKSGLSFGPRGQKALGLRWPRCEFMALQLWETK